MGLTGASKEEKWPRRMDYVITFKRERKVGKKPRSYDIDHEKQLFLNSLSKHQEFTNERKNKKQKRKSTKKYFAERGLSNTHPFF